MAVVKSFASSFFSSEPPANAFDGNATSYWTTNGVPAGWIAAAISPAITCGGYTIRRRDDVDIRNPSSWTFEGTSTPPAGLATAATASTNFSSEPPANAIDGNTGTYWTTNGVSSGWLRIQLPTAALQTGYTIRRRDDIPGRNATAWTFEGSNDGTTWTVLDTRSGVTWPTAGETKTFNFTNSTAYAYYRLNITANGGDQYLSVAEFDFVTSWTVLDTRTGVTWPTVGETKTFDVAGATTYAYYRLNISSPVGGAYTSVAELGFIAVAAPTPLAGVGNRAGVGAAPVPQSGVGNPAGVAGSPPATQYAGGVGNPAGTGSAGHPDSGRGNTAGLSAAPHVVSGVGNRAGWSSAVPSSTATTIPVGVRVETGPLTLLRLVALPGVTIPIGLDVTTGAAQSVVPLPGVSIEIGASLIARQVDVDAPDPRRKSAQWRYVVTDLDNAALGELTDIEHDPVEDGIGEATTMSFTIATDSPEHALIKPVERQCQVWDGNVLRLRGPILPGRPNDDGTSVTYTIHDPSWFWRDGRRVITRIPQKNLIRNGDFKHGLTWWTRGFDADSKPKAAPKVVVVGEDFSDDTDGLDPIKAAQITGVESFTESELSSNAVFWPNLATFRPGGKASIETVANAMPETAGLKVTVIGHTANDGTGNGLVLSKRRADAAAAVIKAKRPKAVITTKGVGFYDPKPGFPIGSQEQRRVVIQYDQTITGESKQWMRQTVEVTQAKTARYPLTLTAAAMLKVADNWSVPDANMVAVKIVARRKGVSGNPDAKLPWNEQLGVGSSSISDTDPVDRWIPQTAEATVPADGRPYLVDVYLYAPAALAKYTAVGLFPEEMLYFWGVDQALIFKGVIEHMQDPAFGHGDLGVGTRAPLTGVRRDREFAFRDLTPVDTALDGLTAISRGLEWDTLTTATATTAAAFYPRQGKTVDYVLVQGGNVTAAVPATTRDVGSSVIAQAQGLGSYRAVAYAKDTRAFGGTLLERVVTAEQDTPLNELGETAKAELFWARSSTPAYWVDIDPDSIADVLAHTGKGDTVRLILDQPEQVDRLARIVRRQIHPDSLRLMVAFEEA